MNAKTYWRDWILRTAVGVVGVAATAVGVRAQLPPGSAQKLAPVDLVGTWVSVVTEDWHLRMMAPEKGDYEGLPLNDEAKKALAAWAPGKDADACKAYGAPAIMRIPGRVKFSWADGDTLQMQTDAGTQTRVLHFTGSAPRGPLAGWQGWSSASWVYGAGFNPLVKVAAGVNQEERARAAGGTLKVVTTSLRAGYLRKNGAPYSEQATLTEYFEILAGPQGTSWFVVTTVLHDPAYLLKDYITSTNFKKEPDEAKWHPARCSFD
jgi:hypothetical protein